MEIYCLSKEDLISAECDNIKNVMEIIEKNLVDFKKGKIMNPDKISQIFDQDTQNRINCLPDTLLDEKVCGMKWVSVFPQNPVKYNLPNVNAVIVLSDINNGLPVAFLDGTLITALRTAAIGGIAAKYLAREDSNTIGFIGAGEQARNHLKAMKSIFPNIKVCKVSDKYPESGEKFIKLMKEIYPDVTFENCGSNYKNAVEGADIIVTATSGQDQILKGEWIKQGAFYCHVGGLEDEFDVPKMASKIVCDDWESVKHRKQTISVMYSDGNLKDSEKKTAKTIEDKYLLHENDILFARSGSVGRCYIHKKTSQPAIFAGYLIRFVLNEKLVNSDYLFYYCNSSIYKYWVESIQRPAVQANINSTEYKSLKIPLPPLSKQQEIAEHIQRIRAQAKQLQAEAEQILTDAKAQVEKMILGE